MAKTRFGKWYSMSRAEKQTACQVLAAQGLSASQIGLRLATTRNAIIGMCHRNGVQLLGCPVDGARKTNSFRRVGRRKPRALLSPGATVGEPRGKHRASPAKQRIQAGNIVPRRRKPKSAPGRKAQERSLTRARNEIRRMAPTAPAPVAGKGGTGLSIFELTAKTCRWPVGEATGLEQRFCGHLPEASGVYCPHHAGIATRPYSEAGA